MLRLLEPARLKTESQTGAELLHHLIEAKKLAYADLEFAVGDPAAMKVRAETLISNDYIAERRRQIDFARARDAVDPDPGLLQSNTTYLVAADQQGNMVSFINSLCGAFGSGMVVPGTDVALQNRGVDFSFVSGRANTVGPRRLPFHTIIPGFATRVEADGREIPAFAFGIVGGANQPQAHVQVFLNLVKFKMNAQEAIDAPRFRHLDSDAFTSRRAYRTLK